MNRRAFIESGVIFAAGSIFGYTAESRARRALKAGLLGATHSHALEKCKLLLNGPDWQLIGAFEEDREARKNLADLGVKLLPRDELFERCEVIMVESAVRDHARDAQLALESGHHVHVEKPPAATYHELKELIDLAAQKMRLLQIGYQWRYHPGFTKIFEAVKAGWLGDIYQVRATKNNFLPDDRRSGWADFNGGGMFELGSHLIDPIIRLLGQPQNIQHTLRTKPPAKDELKDNNIVLFEFDHALALVMNATHQPNAHAHRSFEVCGTAGTATLRPIEPPILQLDLAKAAGPYKAGPQIVHLPAWSRYVGDFAELAAAVRGERHLAVTPAEELLVHECILRACDMWEKKARK
jgi:predicted dehydrogenase